MQWKSNKDRNAVIREMLLAGESISRIARDLHCSKSIVSYYAAKIPNRKRASIDALAVKQNALLATKAYQQKWNRLREEVIALARVEWTEVKKDPEFMGLLGLYWGEGNKRGGNIGIVNNDPGVVTCFLSMIGRLTTQPVEIVVRCYPEHNKEECYLFWTRLLGCDVKIRDKRWVGSKCRMWSRYGLCSVRLSDWRLYIRLITWIAMWRAELTGIKANLDPTASLVGSGLFPTTEFNRQ